MFVLKEDGNIESILLDDADITSSIVYNKDDNGTEHVSGPSINSFRITDNNEIALTYMMPEKDPQVRFYDIATGKMLRVMDYKGSDMEKFVIRDDKLTYYSIPFESKSTPIIETVSTKTGELLERSYFGKDGDEWDGMVWTTIIY